MKKAGIIGYGRFGRILADLLSKKYEVKVCDVELGGSFHTDGSRNFIEFGIRVGIVPWIKRFKG